MLAGKPGDCGVTGQHNRLFIEAVLWICRTGAPWRDLPEGFGNWHTTFTRYNRWSKSGRWETIFMALSQDADFADYVLADKGYDSDEFIEAIAWSGAIAVIPPRCHRQIPREYDRELYKERNLVARFFQKLKQFRRIATRYEKLKRNYQSILYLVSSIIWLL